MATYTQIGSTVTVSSGGAANIEFTSISSTYTDLIIKLSGRTDDASATLLINFNGSTSSYLTRVLYGDGSSAGSYTTSSSLEIPALNWNATTANVFANIELYIPNYAGSTYKTTSIDGVVERNGTTTTYACLQAGLWSNTAAITSIKLFPASGNFVQYSTASLYGIKSS